MAKAWRVVCLTRQNSWGDGEETVIVFVGELSDVEREIRDSLFQRNILLDDITSVTHVADEIVVAGER